MPRGQERRTKIVCTIGPATSSEGRLRELILAGMDVARLNFSHGTHEEHARVIAGIRRFASELDVPVAILQDLAGPKVRIGTFARDSIELEPEQHFLLTTREVEGNEQQVSVSFQGLPEVIQPGDSLLLADGAIELQAERVEGPDIHTRVVIGGALSSHKGINVPSGLFGVPILGEGDLRDLRFGVDRGVDYVGLSFVRTAEDVRTARAELDRLGSDAPLIAKIETQAALDRIEEILAEADGIMIARGDLSIETPFARVPTLQKELIAKARERAKPVVTATQMLFSMVHAPRPTRAEVADVANAILDGSDAIMLSEETAIGAHPVLAVETMDSIARETERAAPYPSLMPHERTHSATEAFARAACQLASELELDVIGALTEDGRTARLVAKCRPRQPILAPTTRPETYRRLALVRGVVPLLLAEKAGTREQTVQETAQHAQARGWKDMDGVFVSSDSILRGRI